MKYTLLQTMNHANKNWLEDTTKAFSLFDNLFEFVPEYLDKINDFDKYPFSDIEEIIENMSDKMAIFNLGCYSSFNWGDDIFFFDGYGNITSCSSCFEYFSDEIDFDYFSDFLMDYDEQAAIDAICDYWGIEEEELLEDEREVETA